MEPLLRGHPYERPTPLERPLGNVNLHINVLLSTPDERPPLFSRAKGLASQERFHCIYNNNELTYGFTIGKPITFLIICVNDLKHHYCMVSFHQ